MAAAPPSYEEQEHALASSSAQAGVARPRALAPPLPPADAQRALAPLSITETTQDIRETFLVVVGENEAAPDVNLQTHHGSIDTTLFFEGHVPRPVGIVAKIANGDIKMVVPSKGPGQAYDFEIESGFGSLAVTLPETFSGLLILSTARGSAKLGDSLRRRSMIIPAGADEKPGTIHYRIAPVPAAPGRGEKPDAQSGRDRCSMKATGNMQVRLYDEMVMQNILSAQGRSNCTLM